MRLFVVLNPVSGRARADEVRQALSRHFAGDRWQVEIYETTGEECLADIVGDAIAAGAERIFAAGGDGTVSAVVDGLAGTAIPLGIIPAGTSNVMAQELGLPLSIDKACLMLSGKPAVRAIDALQVGRQYFILAVGTGLDAVTMEATGRREKQIFGPLAYVGRVLQASVGLQPQPFTITADGHNIHVKAAVVLLSNMGTLTGPFRWGPHIRPDDGRVDICVVRGQNLADYLLAASEMLPLWPGRPRHIRYFSARHSVTVTSEKPLPVQGDGDLIGRTPLEASIRPGSVLLFAPGGNPD